MFHKKDGSSTLKKPKLRRLLTICYFEGRRLLCMHVQNRKKLLSDCLHVQKAPKNPDLASRVDHKKGNISRMTKKGEEERRIYVAVTIGTIQQRVFAIMHSRKFVEVHCFHLTELLSTFSSFYRIIGECHTMRSRHLVCVTGILFPQLQIGKKQRDIRVCKSGRNSDVWPRHRSLS